MLMEYAAFDIRIDVENVGIPYFFIISSIVEKK